MFLISGVFIMMNKILPHKLQFLSVLLLAQILYLPSKSIAMKVSLSEEKEREDVSAPLPRRNVEPLTLREVLNPKNFFEPNNYRNLVFEACQQWINYVKSSDLSLNISSEAIEAINAAARFRHVGSILNLARIHKMHGNGVEAIKLSVLGFQLHWIAKGEHHQQAMVLLNEINSSSDCKVVDEDIESVATFFKTKEKLYPNLKEDRDAKGKIESTLAGLCLTHVSSPYFESYFESYLESVERDLKKTLFGDIFRYNTVRSFGLKQYIRELKRKGYIKKVAYFLSNLGDPDPWFELGTLCQKGEIKSTNIGPNYATAKKYYEKSGSPKALEAIGDLYRKGHIGAGAPENYDYAKVVELYENFERTIGARKRVDWRRLDHLGVGRPDYATAEKYYEKSGSPKALRVIGDFYSHGYIGEDATGKPNLAKAEECYEKSGSPKALRKLGDLYEKGNIYGKPDFEKAKECYEKSGSPKALEAIGDLYSHGYIGEDATGKPNLAKAEEYYMEAQAFYKLGYLYAQGYSGSPQSRRSIHIRVAKYFEQLHRHKGYSNYFLGWIQYSFYKNYTKACECWSTSSFPSAIVEIIHCMKYHSSELGLAREDATKQYDSLKDNLRLSLKGLKYTEEEHHCLGRLAEIEGNYEEALLHYQQALLFGSMVTRVSKERVENIVNSSHEQETLEAEQQQVESTSLPILSEPRKEVREKNDTFSSDSEKDSGSSDEEEESEDQESGDLQGESTDSTEKCDNASLVKGEVKKSKKTSSKALSREARLKKDITRLEKAQEKSARTLNRMKPFLNKSEIEEQPLNITFELLPKIEREYQTMLADPQNGPKLKELLEDIKTKPWAIEGTGKPEVLKHAFKGYKGCISRRITSEHRLVYKVTGPGQILILACETHYK